MSVSLRLSDLNRAFAVEELVVWWGVGGEKGGDLLGDFEWGVDVGGGCLDLLKKY